MMQRQKLLMNAPVNSILIKEEQQFHDKNVANQKYLERYHIPNKSDGGSCEFGSKKVIKVIFY